MGSSVGSFARGFVDDVQVYQDATLEQAHLLRARPTRSTPPVRVALSAFIDGLRSRYDALR